MVPQVVNPRLGRIAVWPSRVGVTWEPVHYGKANGTGGIALQAQIVVGTRNWVVVLMHDEVVASVIEISLVEV